MDVEINWVAVLLAAVVNMVIGGVWYAPKVFGDTWSKIVGLKESDMKQDAAKAMTGAAVLAVVAAYVLAHLSYVSADFFDTSFLSASLSTAFWLWLGVGFTTLLTQGLFERRPLTWTLITAGNLLVALLAMAWVIGGIGY